MQKEAESFELKEEWKTRVDSNTQQKCGAAFSERKKPLSSEDLEVKLIIGNKNAAIAKNDCTDKIAVVTMSYGPSSMNRIVSYYKTFNEDRT